jgi:hypothetical protein
MKDVTQMTLRLWLFAISFFAVCPGTSYASITLVDDTVPIWDISGVITKSDLKDLEQAIQIMRKTKSMPIFRLNSEGGDVEVAIAIGRQLRRFQAYAFTFHQGRCYSACVFILAGAVKRGLSRSIGIHRPYSSSTEQRDYQTTQTAQRQLSKLAKDYLEEMNVSPALYDMMVTIPPEKLRILSESELRSFGFLELDPVQQEIEDAAVARKYGLSKIEFLRRKSDADAKCSPAQSLGTSSGNFDSYFRCREEVLGARK